MNSDALKTEFLALTEPEQIVAFAGRRMHDAGGLPGRLKASAQVAFSLPAAGEKIRRNIDDNTFVAFTGYSNGAVDFTGADEKDVTWLQGIGFSFNNVGGFAS